jgi:hypothetical protein
LGTVEVNLPLYFPTEDIPMGGSDQDLDGDGNLDHVLHVDGDFRGQDDFDLNFSIPELFSFVDLFDYLKNPKNVLTGLTGFFSGINDIADSLSKADIPLIGGDIFNDLKTSLDSLERAVMGEKSEANFTYTADNGAGVFFSNNVTYNKTDNSGNNEDSAEFGVWLQDEIKNENDDIFESILDSIRSALWDGLKGFDSDQFAFMVPVTDANGELQFDDNGQVLAMAIDPDGNSDQVQLQFNNAGL